MAGHAYVVQTRAVMGYLQLRDGVTPEPDTLVSVQQRRVPEKSLRQRIKGHHSHVKTDF